MTTFPCPTATKCRMPLPSWTSFAKDSVTASEWRGGVSRGPHAPTPAAPAMRASGSVGPKSRTRRWVAATLHKICCLAAGTQCSWTKVYAVWANRGNTGLKEETLMHSKWQISSPLGRSFHGVMVGVSAHGSPSLPGGTAALDGAPLSCPKVAADRRARARRR